MTEKSLMLLQFQISQIIETSNCSRSKSAKARDNNEWGKSKINRRIKGSVFLVLNLLLKKKARVFDLVLMSAGSLSPGTLRINHKNHLDICNGLQKGLSIDLIVYKIVVR
jgi:hypothetical protein